MSLPSEIFRSYDIRGFADSQLTDEVVTAIGRAFATRLGGTGTVVIGGDVRLSTPRIRATLAAALQAGGCDVIDIGVVPTPAVYFAMHALSPAGGIQITGSHNPPEYNGFKMCVGLEGLHGEQIQELLRSAESGEFSAGAGGFESRPTFIDDYVEMLVGKIELARPLKVVVDAANGCASRPGPVVFERLGCTVTPLFCTEDGTFPNHPADPTVPEAMVDLQAAVLEHGADVGLGFDGDADRIGIVDDKGRVIWGDRFMPLFFREILKTHPGAPAIIEVKCGMALVEDVVAHGGKPIIYKTGHSLIKAKMKETGAPFTGEMSGHMFFADEFYGHDDALYAASRLLRIIAAQDRPLSALIDEIPDYPATPELRVGCPEDRKFAVVDAVTAALREGREVIDIDGVRVVYPDGWGLVRCSNTSPKLIVRAEGHTAARRDEILGELIAALEVHPDVDLAPLHAALGA